MPTLPSPHRQARQRRRWTLLLLLACLGLVLVLHASRGWIWLGVPAVDAARTPFSDALIHLATPVNCLDGHGQWHGRTCFIPDREAVPRAQTWEPWLSFARLGLDTEVRALAVAWLTVLLFCLAWARVLSPASAGEALLGLVLFATAAVQLAVERANFDLLVAALLCAAAAALARPGVPGALAGSALLAASTVLKLYTGAACAFAWLLARAPLRVTVPACLLALATAIAVVGPQELLVLAGGAPEGATRFSTGARWLFGQAGPAWGWAGVGTGVLAAIATLAWLRPGPAPDPARWPRRLAAFQLSAMTALPLFLLKDSYDYRFVLWLPMAALLVAWLRPGAVPARWRQAAGSGLALLGFVMAVELPASLLDRLADGDAATLAARAAGAAGLAKQFACWALWALLAGLSLRLLELDWRARLAPRRGRPAATGRRP